MGLPENISFFITHVIFNWYQSCFLYKNCVYIWWGLRRPAGQPETPSFPGPDRTGPKPVRGRGTF